VRQELDMLKKKIAAYKDQEKQMWSSMFSKPEPKKE
jgi:hypothetical protein